MSESIITGLSTAAATPDIYSGDPALTGNRDAIRFLVGDTNTGDPLLSDEEIDFCIGQGGSLNQRAAIAARAIAAKFMRHPDKKVGDLSVSNSQITNHYLDLAKRLDVRGSALSVAPYAGGISVSDMDSVTSDSDRVTPAFRIGMDDNPAAGPQPGAGSSTSST